MNSQLADKVIIVTGASGGIGSAIAAQFAEEGATVILHYRTNHQNAKALQKKIGTANALPIQADLTREADVKRLFARTLKHFGRVDTLIANAGSWESRDVPLHEMPLKQWRQTFDHVLTSAFLTTREFFRIVARQKRGNAVLIGSTAAVFGEANHSDYAAAKSAMAFGLTRSLKNELARLAPPSGDYCGGRINCVCPGWTIVPRTAGKLRDAKILRRTTATMALQKVAKPEDIASTTVFLSSDALAGHITGQTIVIAGGMEGRLLWQP